MSSKLINIQNIGKFSMILFYLVSYFFDNIILPVVNQSGTDIIGQFNVCIMDQKQYKV